MLTNKDVLLDLFYQVTDYQACDVDWCEVSNELPFCDPNLAILRVKMKCGKVISVSNQWGNIHVIEREPHE